MTGRELKKWRQSLESKETKRCPYCGETKDKLDFSWASSYKGNRKPACKQCEAYVHTVTQLTK